MPGREYTSEKYRFGYQGSEKDNDIAQDNYTTHFRMLDTRLGRWFSRDPKATAFESPYVSMGNNPIWYNDVLGDTLDVGNKDLNTVANSYSDILSLVGSKNQQYVKQVGENNVQLDFGKLKQDDINNLLASDEGLNLVNDLVTSEENYLYESSEIALFRNNGGVRAVAFLSKDDNLVHNASSGGKDGGGGYFVLPKDGYDGQVIIHPDAVYEERNSQGTVIKKTRAAIIFHELAENYERTSNGINYHNSKKQTGAHDLAKNREACFAGKSCMPGELSSYPYLSSQKRTKSNPAFMKPYKSVMTNYMLGR